MTNYNQVFTIYRPLLLLHGQTIIIPQEIQQRRRSKVSSHNSSTFLPSLFRRWSCSNTDSTCHGSLLPYLLKVLQQYCNNFLSPPPPLPPFLNWTFFSSNSTLPPPSSWAEYINAIISSWRDVSWVPDLGLFACSGLPQSMLLLHELYLPHTALGQCPTLQPRANRKPNPFQYNPVWPHAKISGHQHTYVWSWDISPNRSSSRHCLWMVPVDKGGRLIFSQTRTFITFDQTRPWEHTLGRVGA